MILVSTLQSPQLPKGNTYLILFTQDNIITTLNNFSTSTMDSAVLKVFSAVLFCTSFTHSRNIQMKCLLSVFCFFQCPGRNL